MLTMNNKDAEILKQLEYEKKWSKGTLTAYRHSINLYCEFHKISLYNLLDEAENEEIQGIRWKNRKLLKRLVNFRSFLVDNYKGDSIRSHFNRILSIYNHFLIEIHKIPPLDTKTINKFKQITYNDLITKNLLRKGVEISKPDMTAIIFFMSSSGCARAETLSFTIRDFIFATYRHNYHRIPYQVDEKNLKKRKILENNNINLFIESLIDYKKDIIPTFDIHRVKTNKYYSTFCSGEAVEAILNHLITRPDHDKLNYDSKLFKMDNRYFTERFKDINDKLKLGKTGKYNVFSSHILRKYHASNLIRKGESGHSLTEKQVDSLQGRGKIDSRKSYMFDDYEALREEYISCLNNITLYDNKSLIKQSKEYKEIKNRVHKKDEKIAELEKEKENNDLLAEKIKILEQHILDPTIIEKLKKVDHEN